MTSSRFRTGLYGFNGAVTFWLRKLHLPELSATQILSFNGAVTFWLRKYVLVPRVRRVFRPLQWGRNFLVTEIKREALESLKSQMLQWGRNFLVTEILDIERGLRRGVLLQWGRNFLVTEIDVRIK